uniref:hypothetical protein n=1 Tax=Pseudomonas aeruginosa TaxID=287 RepID=UPI001160F2ED|nr:hypothetical protein [Pseudomonas aeruginosa]
MPDLESVLLANARQHLGSLRAAVSEGADFWQVRDSITAVKTLLSFGAEANLLLAESVRSELACIDLEIAALQLQLQGDGEGKGKLAATVQITGHLDEIDAPVWPFINEEAVKVGAKFGHIDSYRYERACGGVVTLWDGHHLHALAVTVRDDMNRTRCIRVLNAPKPACAPDAP